MDKINENTRDLCSQDLDRTVRLKTSHCVSDNILPSRSILHPTRKSEKSCIGMRVVTPVALLGVAGLGEAWRPSTAPSRRCGAPSVNRNNATLIRHHHTTTTAEQQASSTDCELESPTTQSYDSARRTWIRRALTFSSIVLSSAAQAALAGDLPTDLQEERRVSNYPVSPFRQWLNSMRSDKDSSRGGGADDSSVGASTSNDSSSDGGKASSSDAGSIP